MFEEVGRGKGMSQRYQREIEEILDQVNEDAAADKGRPKGQQEHPQPPKALGQRRRWNLSPGRLMLMGISILVLSLPVGAVFPALTAPAALLGIALFIGAYVVFFSKPRPYLEKRWRGQPIEDLPEVTGLQRFWSWLTRG